MKKFAITIQLLLLFAVLSITMQAQQWQSIWTGVTDDLYDICCIDENTIFVCGQNGVILKSVNGGVTWQEKHRNPNWEIISIQFVNESIGYGLVLKNGNLTFLIKTTDSGESWYRTGTSDQIESFALKHPFNDPLDLFIMGKPIDLCVLNADTLFIRHYEILIRSTDGGLTYDCFDLGFSDSESSYGWDNGIKGGYFNDGFGFVIGYDDNDDNTIRVMRTGDCGDNWDNVANYTFAYCHISSVYSDKNGHTKIYGLFYNYNGSGLVYNMIESYDGFEHATLSQTTGLYYEYQYQDVAFCSRERGCFIASSNLDKEYYSDSYTYITDDGGVSWAKLLNGINRKMFVFSVVETGNTFLVTTQFGTLYKYDDGTTQDILENEIKTEVFPNPAADKIEICSENAHTIELYDVFGKKVFGTFVENNNTSIDISKLPAGVYTVVIQNNSGAIHTEKVVKL